MVCFGAAAVSAEEKGRGLAVGFRADLGADWHHFGDFRHSPTEIPPGQRTTKPAHSRPGGLVRFNFVAEGTLNAAAAGGLHLVANWEISINMVNLLYFLAYVIFINISPLN